MSESTALAVREPASSNPVSVWQSPASFEAAQRMANALVNSKMVPDAYKGAENMGSALIALDIAQRVNASPLMVMQNLHIISGRPSWGASFIIAALNSCGKFSPLRFRVEDRGEADGTYTEWTGSQGNRTATRKTLRVPNKSCVAYAIEKATGEVLEGPEVSVVMAVSEGWYTKRDSKWPTMTDLMLRYRAAAFFGRLYAPDLLMGMSTDDELRDISDVEYAEVRAVQAAPAPKPAAEETKPRRASRVAAAMATTGEGAGEPAKAAAPKVSSGTKPEAKPAQQAAPIERVEAEPVDDPRPIASEYEQASADGDYDDGGRDYAEQSGDVI